MDIRQSEDELFRNWKGKYDSFVIDGVPRPDAFLASPSKVVFVLKDINAPDVQGKGEFDLRLELERDPHPWWRTIANWCAVIYASPKALAWSEVQRIPIKQCLEPFAFVQLKKTAGGGSVHNKKLIEYARNDANEIRAQFAIYRPNVIVCCGVGQIVAKVLGGAPWHETDRGVSFMKLSLYADRTTYLINYMHPSARATKNVVCYGLFDAYAEIVGGLERGMSSASTS